MKKETLRAATKTGLLLTGLVLVLGMMVFAGCDQSAPSPATAPATPAGLQVTATSSTSITISWTAVPGAVSYKVYRSATKEGNYEAVDNPVDTSSIDTGLQPDTTYWYKVTALNADGESGQSITKSATTTDGGGYSVTYYANGASGTVPPTQTATADTIVYAAWQSALTYEGKTFTGWNTKADGTGASYAAGSSLTVTADVTLYAQWVDVSATAATTLKAVAVATSPNSPAGVHVLDSYTDGTKNYYLIDVGRIQNTYVSTILSAHFNGQTPVTTSRTTVSTTTITNSITETISKSITESDTQNHTAGIEAAWKKKFPVAGTFSVKLKYEWKGSWTNSETNTSTIETSSSTITSFAETNSTSVTIGEHGEAAGSYRYAMYTVCDVYFIISTSLDNSTLLNWDTVVSAGSNELIPHMDYSPDGKFDNSPEYGNTINFSDNFFKTLPTPESYIPIVTPPPPPEVIVLPLDVWGGKLEYSYEVLISGDITYTLIGGGAGGAGAAAVRDSGWLFGETEADAGWSADGGPTVLKLNDAVKATADGGAKVDGPSKKVDGAEWYSNGLPGGDGKSKTGTLPVLKGDKITIVVGYGGGGSGGAAANDTAKKASSGSADKTLGSEGSYSSNPGSTSANASRGGMGAMHSLIFPSNAYPSDLQKGSSSPAAGGATAAAGGQIKGQGGSAGDELATGGMYASGGGGGAAGGFTLNSQNVSLAEIK
jgi:fibronectin type 3 domain-containing protein